MIFCIQLLYFSVQPSTPTPTPTRTGILKKFVKWLRKAGQMAKRQEKNSQPKEGIRWLSKFRRTAKKDARDAAQDEEGTPQHSDASLSNPGPAVVNIANTHVDVDVPVVASCGELERGLINTNTEVMEDLDDPPVSPKSSKLITPQDSGVGRSQKDLETGAAWESGKITEPLPTDPHHENGSDADGVAVIVINDEEEEAEYPNSEEETQTSQPIATDNPGPTPEVDKVALAAQRWAAFATRAVPEVHPATKDDKVGTGQLHRTGAN
ncbi:hypothetical protein HK102_013202 [Quaeritorhiza haematococci]|nr:hypothetical protein HK102_013202 [Quaeritorhiza haematococci]